MRRLIFAVSFALGCSSPHQSIAQQAYIDACAKSLNVNEISGYNDSVVQLALLTYMTSQSSDETDFHSKFSGLIAAGFFDGTLSGARQKRDELEKGLSLSFTHESASGYMAKYLSTEGSGAFAKCVETVFSSPGIHLALKEADSESIGAQMIFRTAAGENRSFKVRIASDGEMPAGISVDVPAGGISRDFIITKVNPAKNLHVQVDILNGSDVIASGSLFVPPYVTSISTTSRNLKTSAESSAECGSYKDDHSYPGTQVSINPDDGFLFDTSTVNARMTKLNGERGKVPGPGSTMEVLKKDPSTIAARAWCQPGSSTDEHYWTGGVVESYQTKTESKLIPPIDNSIPTRFKIILQ